MISRGELPAVCEGFIPIPSFVIMALVSGGTLNYIGYNNGIINRVFTSSAENFNTAVNGVCSGTLNL